MHDVPDEIQPFLGYKPCDNAVHWYMFIHFESKCLLHGSLIHQFGGAGRFETGDDGRVREWIIIQDIQTIDDTVEIVPPAGKHRLQPLSETRGEVFTCISIGNRRYD